MNQAETCEVLAQMLPGDYKLTDHFKVSELSCKHCGLVYVTPPLLIMMEKLRSLAGVKLAPVSGYRCPKHNRDIGGASRSKHSLGMAVDIKVPKEYREDPTPFIEAAESVAKEVHGGFHFYPSGMFIHMDCWVWPEDRRW